MNDTTPRRHSTSRIGKYLEPWPGDNEEEGSGNGRRAVSERPSTPGSAQNASFDLAGNEKRKSTYGTVILEKAGALFPEEEDLLSDESIDGDDYCCSFSARPPFIKLGTLPQLPPRKVLWKMVFNWQTLKVVVVMAIFAFTLWLFTTASGAADAEKVPNLSAATSKAVSLFHHLDPGKPFAIVNILVTPQQINKIDYPVPTNITFIVEVSVEVNETEIWLPLRNWTAEALVNADASYTHDFDLDDLDYDSKFPDRPVRIEVATNSPQPVGMQLQIRQLEGIARYQTIFAAIILVLVYVLIIFELIHRTIVALIGSFCALAVLSAIQQRPSFLVVVSWIDYDTLGLLFGMMLMVGILADTGFFEYCAVKAYKLSRGRLWRLLIILCVLVAVLSAFLDNVTTILLLTPVTIRLCKVIDLNPLPIILSEVLFCNIGGTATAIGDPPNILIVNDSKIQASGQVDFGNFMLHMTPGIVVIAVVCFGLVRYMFRKELKRSPRMALLKEINIWKRTAEKMKVHDGDEEKVVRDKLLDYIKQLELEMEIEEGAALNNKLDEESSIKTLSVKSFVTPKVNIRELEDRYKITDKPLFVKSMAVLLGVIILFFSHSFIHVNLNLAWIAIIGAMILLLVSGIRDVETVLEKIELGTLMFFAGLFVLMHTLEEMGLMTYIADITTKEIIARVPEGDARLTVAIVVIIWVSALASAFIDNIPFTKAMIPVVVTLSSSDLGLPLQPLVWALSFGCCLGGNGTLIGASANVVAAGLSEAQGYPISFVAFFKVGFPVMILSTFVATCYMLVFHVVIPWY